AKACLEVGRKAEIEHEIDRVHAALARHVGEPALVEGGIGQVFGDQRVAEAAQELVGCAVHLAAERPAEAVIGIEALLAGEIGGRYGPEQRHALEHEGLAELELEIERTRRHLRIDAIALRRELERARELRELVEQQALARGRLQHAAPGLAERAGERADLGEIGGAARYRATAIP